MTITDKDTELEEDRPDDGTATMTIYEHLAELRNRMLVSFVAVILAAVVVWIFYGHLILFMRGPYCAFTHAHPSKSLTGNGSCSLVTNGPLEGLGIRIKVSAYGGIALASPVLFFELWRFITPGLKQSEKRYALPFVSAATVLFAMGVTTSILIFPRALRWLITVSGTGVVPLFSPAKYFSLYVIMCVIFGAVFMYPLIVVALELTGVVPSAKWRKWRRPAIVAIFAVAAIITPSSDPFSFLAMAMPMLVFYEVAIVVGRVLGK